MSTIDSIRPADRASVSTQQPTSFDTTSSASGGANSPMSMMRMLAMLAPLLQQLLSKFQNDDAGGNRGGTETPQGHRGGGGGGGSHGGGAAQGHGKSGGGTDKSHGQSHGDGTPRNQGKAHDRDTTKGQGTTEERPHQTNAGNTAPASKRTDQATVRGAGGSAAVPPASGTTEVNKPIFVAAGQTFDGGGKLFRAGAGLNGGGTAETQLPIFVLGQGATLKNVQFEGGDGVHLMGDGKIDNVHAVHGGPDDMITINGAGNRAADAKWATGAVGSLPSRPAQVEITNSSFHHSHDKVVQVNGDANIKMKNVQADDVGQLLVTLGGKPIQAHVSIEDSSFSGVRSHLVRLDSRQSTLDLAGVKTDTGRIQVMMGTPANAQGATHVMTSTDPA